MEQYMEVLNKLNSISLDNDFIFEFQKVFFEGREEIIYTENIRWRVAKYTLKRNEIGVLFLADYFLQIHICRHTIELSAPFRYSVLEKLSDETTYQAFKNWSHVWRSIVKGLGGDKIVYLPESGFDKYLELHWDNNSMDKITEELK
jgi:predicted nucleotidyltransferase